MAKRQGILERISRFAIERQGINKKLVQINRSMQEVKGVLTKK